MTPSGGTTIQTTMSNELTSLSMSYTGKYLLIDVLSGWHVQVNHITLCKGGSGCKSLQILDLVFVTLYVIGCGPHS